MTTTIKLTNLTFLTTTFSSSTLAFFLIISLAKNIDTTPTNNNIIAIVNINLSIILYHLYINNFTYICYQQDIQKSSKTRTNPPKTQEKCGNFLSFPHLLIIHECFYLNFNCYTKGMSDWTPLLLFLFF